MADICDYEGSTYRTDFWEGRGREYEDLAERIALGRLLPPDGARLVEIGAGFGRLVDLYDGYQEVVLLDYSKSMLRQAQERLGQFVPLSPRTPAPAPPRSRCSMNCLRNRRSQP